MQNTQPTNNHASQQPRAIDAFAEYVRQYYATGGFCDIDATDDEIREAVKARRAGTVRPDLSFEGDTTDREVCRDYIRAMRADDVRARAWLLQHAGTVDEHAIAGSIPRLVLACL